MSKVTYDKSNESSIELQSIEITQASIKDSFQDKLYDSTADDIDISTDDIPLIEIEEEYLVLLFKEQYTIKDYSDKNDIAFCSRSNILTWASKLLNALTLTPKEKHSIFHRFSSAYDLINERIFLKNKQMLEDNQFKIMIIALFVIVYKLEGYTIGKITIQSLKEAFLHDMNIKDIDIRRTEVKLLQIFNYDTYLFEINMNNLTIMICELIKKKYSLSNDLSKMIDNKRDKMNRTIQFSNGILFDILQIDKAAISIYALILYLKNENLKNKNKEGMDNHHSIHCEISVLIKHYYMYMKNVLKIITIPQCDFKHHATIYSESTSMNINNKP